MFGFARVECRVTLYYSSTWILAPRVEFHYLVSLLLRGSVAVAASCRLDSIHRERGRDVHYFVSVWVFDLGGCLGQGCLEDTKDVCVFGLGFA